MPKQLPLIRIQPSACSRFMFGNCAIIAISGAFKKKYKYVKDLYDFIGVDSQNGVTTREIKKRSFDICVAIG